MTLSPDWTYVPPGSTTPDQYGPTDYSEALGAGDISTSPGNPGVTRTFYILHSVIPSFFDDLLGFASIDNDGKNGDDTSDAIHLALGARQPQRLPLRRTKPNRHPQLLREG